MTPHRPLPPLRGNHDERPALFRTRRGPENLCLFGDDWTTWELSEDRDQGRRICITGREPSNAVLTSPELDPSCINIVMLHGQVREGYTAPDPESVPLSALRAPCADAASITWPLDTSITFVPLRWMIGESPPTAAVLREEVSTSAVDADLSCSRQAKVLIL